VGQPRIRPVALCVLSRSNRILVEKSYDHVKQQIFFRPTGGGIEFGEPGANAAIREVAEELGIPIGQPHYLGTLENIFVCRGKAGHELAQIYHLELSENDWANQATLVVVESPSQTHILEWHDLAFFHRETTPLYPHGLLDLLRGLSILSS